MNNEPEKLPPIVDCLKHLFIVAVIFAAIFYIGYGLLFWLAKMFIKA